MAKSKLIKVNKKIADTAVSGFQKMSDTVVNSYSKIEDKFVDQYLTKEDEAINEAKKRLRQKHEDKLKSRAGQREIRKANSKAKHVSHKEEK